jgi:multidrug efflux pump subunit AcrA (membrane-fusion protein)
VDPGNLVGYQDDTLLTTLIQYDPIYANFDLSEREVLRISESSTDRRSNADRVERIRQVPLELGLSNEEGYSFKGTVHYTDLAIDPGTGTYLIRGIFPNPHPIQLLPGLFVRIRTPIRERENALLVTVRVIESGLKADEWVIVEGVLRARPGAKVSPQRKGESTQSAVAPGPGNAAKAGTPSKER